MDSGVGEFFQQLPIIFIVIFCGSGAVLIGVIAYLVNFRRQRALTRLFSLQNANATSSQIDDSAQGANDADFPDLDALLAPAPASMPAEAPPAAPLPAPLARPKSGTFRVALADGSEAEAAEVLVVLRDLMDGSLIIQIADKAYRNPPAGADAEFRRRFDGVLADLSPRISAAAPSTGVLVTPPPPAPRTPPPPADPTMPDLPDLPLPGDLPKFRMPEKIEPPKRGRIKPDRTPVPEINIAAAIEAFLQHKRELDDPFAGRSIHISQATNGGVLIEVDGIFYEAVADVTDEAVRAYLANTIQEWQDRQI